MTKDELIKELGLFCEANPPLEYVLNDTGERLELTIEDENDESIADACFITYEVLALDNFPMLLEARLAEVKRTYEEMMGEK